MTVDKPRCSWLSLVPLTVLCTGLGLFLIVQIRTQQAARQAIDRQDWAFVAADLIDSNARLRSETEALGAQLAALQEADGGAAVLELLVDEVNQMRIANGLVEVSGPGVEVTAGGRASAVDLQDLINELRNAGAEALALGGRRLVARSAIGSDGANVTVDGAPVQPPYRLEAIGDAATLESALTRPGGVIALLEQAGTSVSIVPRQSLTLPIVAPALATDLRYARPVPAQ